MGGITVGDWIKITLATAAGIVAAGIVGSLLS